MMIKCVWIILDLSNGVEYKKIVMLVVRKRMWLWWIMEWSKKSDRPDFWIIIKKKNKNNIDNKLKLKRLIIVWKLLEL